MSRLLLVLVTAGLISSSCSCEGAPVTVNGGPDAGDALLSGRCEADLTPFIAERAGRTSIKHMRDEDALKGPTAFGRAGDYLLENDLVRVVVQGPGRRFGPQPWGGTILDADLQRADGGSNDQFGELGLLYNFGRTVKAELFEVLDDGLDGGAVVLAASGDDTPNDYLSIRNKLAESLGKVPAVDPYVAVPLRITNYFVLNPGEQRVRFVTAMCNTSLAETVALAVGDLTDPGDALEFFNPLACTRGFGFGGLCFGLDRMSWYGYQGVDVAYGYAPWKAGSPNVVERQNATLSVAGITGSIIGANGLEGLGTWVQPTTSTPRDGELRVPPRGQTVLARDFWVGHTLGELNTLIEASRGSRLTEVTVLVREGGRPVDGARVAFSSIDERAVLTTGADGFARGRLRADTWTAAAWKQGRMPTDSQRMDLASVSSVSLNFELTPPRKLTVNVRERSGAPLPAKVTVMCPNGPCPLPRRKLVPWTDVTKDPLPDSIALVGLVPASGSATFELPAGQYVIVVSRGPEYSVFPNTWPDTTQATFELRTNNLTLNAVLARVIDTTGWMSADFHVHAVNSPDSIVSNDARALSFAAEGIDVIVSTDHDVVTDYAPAITRTGLSPFLASVIGEEVSPMEWGHYNAFPLTLDASEPLNGGAIDWAGGDGPTLTVGEIFATMRARGARTVHVNHPRGALGGFSFLKVDTDTFATHADPATFRMAPQPGATPNDTKLISSDFNALEVLNPGDDELDGTSDVAHARFNDWFTLLSHGLRVAATGVSDTHYEQLMTGWRTWVDVGVDTPAQLTPALLSERLNAARAVASNGPFVKMRAFRVNAAGAMVTMPVGLGGTVAPDAKDLVVELDLQVPEYLDLTRVELYMHTPADDASCPIEPLSSLARTTRVACDGQQNSNWPTRSITASQSVALTSQDLETVGTDRGVSFKRWHKTVSFRLPSPAEDNWIVGMVYGSRSLAPLLFASPGFTGSVKPTAPFAITNPIFVDADGNGYDHPPGRIRSASGRRYVGPAAKPPLPTDRESILERWGVQFGGH